jgi:hypothetical protein
VRIVITFIVDGGTVACSDDQIPYSNLGDNVYATKEQPVCNHNIAMSIARVDIVIKLPRI